MNCSPWTIETTAITAATPMMIPRVVRTERMALARRAASAIRKFSRKTTALSGCSRGASGVAIGGSGGSGGGGGPRRRLVGDDLAVLERHLALGEGGDIGLVGDQDDGIAGAVELGDQ